MSSPRPPRRSSPPLHPAGRRVPTVLMAGEGQGAARPCFLPRWGHSLEPPNEIQTAEASAHNPPLQEKVWKGPLLRHTCISRGRGTSGRSKWPPGVGSASLDCRVKRRLKWTLK